MKTSRLAAAGALVLLVTGGIVGCAPPQKRDDGTRTSSGVKASEATSAADFGGMDGLIAAAKKEGQLNVIAVPPDWANYGAIIKAFSDKYGIAVTSAQPDGNSQDEINAATQQKGKSTAPDVFDLGQSVALANTAMFAPYKVATFGDVSESMKDPDGKWVNDYGGYMSIGFDSSKVPDITSVDDLMKPEFKGKVALNGDPTQAGAGFSGVMMAAVSQGGSADDIAPGVEFFGKLNQAGNFLPIDPTPATIESGETPVVIDWDYLNVAETAKLPTWRVIIPANAAVAGYYFQAINAGASHPAAARLWEEFLFSDEGQNLYLYGHARPVRADMMVIKGAIDLNAYRQLPPLDGGSIVQPTEPQTQEAKKYLEANWAKAIG
jgi:putative spermidine/putrescine transport system substrate-binding protein